MEANQVIHYYNLVTQMSHRLLSWEDREPFSITYGCFDRTFWSWKFTDFAGARFQEGVYTLAYFYKNEFPGNAFTTENHVLEWSLAGMRFWRTLQYPDGSFDEAYPFEHSLAATAFTSFYIGEAFLLLQEQIPPQEQDEMRRTFSRAGDWLCKNDEHHGILSNHLAAAAAALQVIYQISGEKKYKKRCDYFLQRIYKHQSDEGWYEEYGGADPGYQTHATFYLARLWQLTQDEELLDSLEQSIKFLQYFIHPNATLGGEYGSRNTEFYFPAGFEILAPIIPEAAYIASFMRSSVANQRVVGLMGMDAYNFLPMFNNYLFAAANTREVQSSENALPCQNEFEKDFPDAGLCVKCNSVYFIIVGISKGGVLKAYQQTTKKLIIDDCGYWVKLSGNKVISSQNLNRARVWNISNNELIIISDFGEVNQRTQTPWLFLGFRLFTLTLGRIQPVAYWLKNILVQVLVRRRKEYPLFLTRRVIFGSDHIIIYDQVEGLSNVKAKELRNGNKFSTIHMGSSRYYQPQELDSKIPQVHNWHGKIGIEGKFINEQKVNF